MADADIKLKQGIREKAQKELEIWYEQRKASIEKQKAKNRLTEASEVEEGSSSSVEPSKYE